MMLEIKSKHLLHLLVSNRECSSAILEVSTEGLARVNFKIDDFDSTYYIVSMQDVY